MSVADLRQTYDKGVLLESQAAASPFDQFTLWFDQALAAAVPEPNAMTLATVDASGQPSARTVLIKNFDARGFVF
ncbi:MAG: pyridoxamine 5'-phosphate oxidase family protein, partial [Achromobacter sp.]